MFQKFQDLVLLAEKQRMHTGLKFSPSAQLTGSSGQEPSCWAGTRGAEESLGKSLEGPLGMGRALRPAPELLCEPGTVAQLSR